MMKFFLRANKTAIFIFVLMTMVSFCLSGPALAAGREKDPGMPRLKLHETYYDAGRRPGGSMVRHDFTIENTGSRELVIKKVATGCRCTVADYDKVIAPGRKGRITVLLELSPKWAGRRVEQTVRLYTNDRQNLGARLVVSTEVTP